MGSGRSAHACPVGTSPEAKVSSGPIGSFAGVGPGGTAGAAAGPVDPGGSFPAAESAAAEPGQSVRAGCGAVGSFDPGRSVSAAESAAAVPGQSVRARSGAVGWFDTGRLFSPAK